MFRLFIVVLVVLAFILLFITPGFWTGHVPFWTYWSGQSTAEFFRPPSWQQQATAPPASATFVVAPAQPQPQQREPKQTGFSLQQGEIRDVSAGMGCFGDLDLWTGSSWYSPYLHEADLDNTGQVVIFTANTRVKAAYPGSCAPDASTDTMSNSMRQNGCLSGCRNVNIVYWP